MYFYFWKTNPYLHVRQWFLQIYSEWFQRPHVYRWGTAFRESQTGKVSMPTRGFIHRGHPSVNYWHLKIMHVLFVAFKNRCICITFEHYHIRLTFDMTTLFSNASLCVSCSCVQFLVMWHLFTNMGSGL